MFLAACSQRTKRIQLGHGITLMPPNYNHPARVAERIATLDLVSNGRVEWGTGESATAVEMDGFGVDPEDKRAMWEEGTREAANMLAMRPYPGFHGRWFEMPCRNLVPKAVQRPHPPMWVACSRRETIHLAARNGVGALTFSFLDPDQAAKWVEEYYAIIKSDECVPIGHRVNPNIAIVTGMSCHPDEAEAIRRGLDGFRFFGYSLGYYALFGEHRPGRADLWERFLQVKDQLPDKSRRWRGSTMVRFRVSRRSDERRPRRCSTPTAAEPSRSRSKTRSRCAKAVGNSSPCRRRSAGRCRFSLHCLESLGKPQRGAVAMADLQMGLVTTVSEVHEHWSVVSVFFTLP